MLHDGQDGAHGIAAGSLAAAGPRPAADPFAMPPFRPRIGRLPPESLLAAAEVTPVGALLGLGATSLILALAGLAAGALVLG